jgi:hypothetical protein
MERELYLYAVYIIHHNMYIISIYFILNSYYTMDSIDISQPYNLQSRIGLHAVNQKLRVYDIIRVINILF